MNPIQDPILLQIRREAALRQDIANNGMINNANCASKILAPIFTVGIGLTLVVGSKLMACYQKNVIQTANAELNCSVSPATLFYAIAPTTLMGVALYCVKCIRNSVIASLREESERD